MQGSKKKISRKEKAKLAAEKAEFLRREQEREKMMRMEEEKAKIAQEREKLEQRQMKEITENKTRKFHLEETYRVLATIKRQMREQYLNEIKKNEWKIYMRCNGLPNPKNPPDLRKYLHNWRQAIDRDNDRERNWLLSVSEQSVLTQNANMPDRRLLTVRPKQPDIGTKYAEKTTEVLGILDEIEFALEDVDMKKSKLFDLRDLKVEYRELLADYVDEYAYKILSNINRDMELVGYLNVHYKFDSKDLKMQLYAHRDMPQQQL